MTRLLCLLALCALCACVPAGAQDPPRTDARVPLVLVGVDAREPVIPISDTLSAYLRAGRWDQAARRLQDAGAPEGQEAAWSFLLAWCLVHAGRPAEAEDLLATLGDGGGAPPAYLDLVRGEVLRAIGEPLEALEVLGRIPPEAATWPRAEVQRAEVLRELGRTSEAWPLYQALVEREDPAPGNALALLALATHHGAGSDEAYPLLRRLWAAYPQTEEAREADRLLREYTTRPTWQEVARRAEALMALGDWNAAIAATEPYVAEVDGDSQDACRFLYARGRSQYKRNRLTDSIATLDGIGARCVSAEGGYGHRGQYLLGTALFRKKRYTAAAAAFAVLPESYPESSYADDGLTQAGIALHEAGELEGARDQWSRALADHPTGDTVPEATWRMAWALYLAGEPDRAREVAAELGALPPHGDRVHVLAGRYWHARWALYPDVVDPRRPSDAPGALDQAIAGWRSLCQEAPRSYYAILAYSRLREVAPEVAEALAARDADQERPRPDQPWAVRPEFLDRPEVQDGLALARLGLVAEARVEWSGLELDNLSGSEMALLIDTRGRAGDWLYAHDELRRWLRSHPPGTLGPREAQVLRLAYPDRYWSEVQEAAGRYSRYEPRLLHALVREESNFNRRIRSHAGARGLTQLMPATARQTAGWLGRTVTMKDLEDPVTNLEIGAKYLDVVHKQFAGSPYLALAAYNAGGGNVGRWLGEHGDVPTDELVEHIPFRETRGYVKRVMGTWQTMRFEFDEGDAFPDLSAYNHQARPGS